MFSEDIQMEHWLKMGWQGAGQFAEISSYCVAVNSGDVRQNVIHGNSKFVLSEPRHPTSKHIYDHNIL